MLYLQVGGVDGLAGRMVEDAEGCLRMSARC